MGLSGQQSIVRIVLIVSVTTIGLLHANLSPSLRSRANFASSPKNRQRNARGDGTVACGLPDRSNR
jgi:hypothetical protein